MKKSAFVTVAVLCLFALLAALHSVKSALAPARVDLPPSEAQENVLRAAITLMRQHGLGDDAALAAQLQRQGKWRAAGPSDGYLAQAERAGDMPYAYTLAEGRKAIAVVLAPRFFADATPTGRAALMIHEMGHVRAYQKAGRSDEYDGYRREYDAHAKLGLTERDGLVYFSLLDGVVEYVVPRAPAYKARPDIKAYLAQSSGN